MTTETVVDASPQPQTAAPAAAVDQHSLRNLTRFQAEFQRIQPAVTDRLSEVAGNREVRRSYVDVATLRSEKKIPANGTYIPIRSIDKNIETDMPQFVSYLTQAPRLVIMQPTSGAYKAAGHPTDFLELEFTRVLKHKGWADAYIRAIDGAQLNGWAWFEVVYDPDKPGRVRIDCVNFDELIFDVAVSCIQYSRIVARKYNCSRVRLDELASQYQFNPKLVDQLREEITNNNFTSLYHVFFKEAGIVYSGWYVPDKGMWLRDPVQFFNGVLEEHIEEVFEPLSMEPRTNKSTAQAAETKYPYFILQYRVTEEMQIGMLEGRATLDFPLQDAASSMMSALVNGCIQASNTMWSPKNPDMDSTGAPKQTEAVIKANAIWDKPMDAFTSPWPDPTMFKALEFLRSVNSADNAQIDFAVNNRRDSRKTATEIQAAAQQASLLSGTTLFLFSNTLRNVFTAAWRIVQSQALLGNMPFAQTAAGENNTAMLSEVFNILPAGDVDYVQRQERIVAMQQDLQLVAGTPIADAFMREYFRLRYPDMAERFNAAMQQQQTNDAALIQQLAALLQAVAVDDNGQLQPDLQPYAQQLQQLQGAVVQRLGAAGPANAQRGAGQNGPRPAPVG